MPEYSLPALREAYNLKLEVWKRNINLLEIEELDIACRATIYNFIQNITTDHLSMLKIEAVIYYTKERLNIGNWKEVQPYLRKTMTIISFIKFNAYVKACIDEDQEYNESATKEMFKVIDYGLLFGQPLDKDPWLLQKCATLLSSIVGRPGIIIYYRDFINKNYTSDYENIKLSMQKIPTQCKELGTISCPSLVKFGVDYVETEKPIILEDCMNHWPALKKWPEKAYLLKMAGDRTIPVEVGSKYTDADWTQKLMTFADFVNDHIFYTTSKTGYLAQYQLLHHIPELKRDIVVPDYCILGGNLKAPEINVWFGPKGTVTPLHHDPKRNFLAQIFGEKLVYLFPPSESEFLYPYEDELLSNSARVDPRKPDLDLYPKFADAKGYYCILRPGQMLFIPPKWWHYVESLSVSFSVSFWW